MSLNNPADWKSNSWWDSEISTKEVIDLESVSFLHRFHQLITGPTQPNLVIGSSAHYYLHTSCYHQITHYKLNLKIVSPPPYEHLVWNYQRIELTAIRKALYRFK